MCKPSFTQWAGKLFIQISEQVGITSPGAKLLAGATFLPQSPSSVGGGTAQTRASLPTPTPSAVPLAATRLWGI